MSSPIKLTDAELSYVFEAPRPLAVERCDAFLQEIANALRSCSGSGHCPSRDCHGATRAFRPARGSAWWGKEGRIYPASGGLSGPARRT